MTGGMFWINAPSLGSGAAETLNVSGCRYDRSAGTNPWPYNQATLILHGGGLASSLAIPILRKSGQLRSDAVPGLAISFSAADGFFYGQAKLNDAVLRIRGVVLQGTGTGQGFFLDKASAGTALLEAAGP